MTTKEDKKYLNYLPKEKLAKIGNKWAALHELKKLGYSSFDEMYEAVKDEKPMFHRVGNNYYWSEF